MIKAIVLSVFTIFIFNGCSVKEFNEGVESVTNDISNVFEEGKDKAAD